MQQAQNIMTAAAFSLAIGKPLTRHWTVRLERQGISDKGAVEAIGRLLTLLRDHVRKTTGGEIAYIWERENAPTIGSHVHILLHLPAGYALRGHRSRRWLERISGKPYKTGASLTKRIGGTAKAHERNPEFYLANLMAVVAYGIKGTAADAAAMLELELVKPQGRIIGKRCGTSQNIGAKARAGYSETTAYSIGNENLNKPEIAEAIKIAMDERAA